MGRRLSTAVACAALALALAGCRDDAERARAVLLDYCAAVVAVHRSGNAAALRQVASPDEVDRVAMVAEGLRLKRLVLRAQLDRLEVVEARLPASGPGEATAREEWTYRRSNLETRQDEPLQRVRSLMRYRLARRDGAWVVDRVEFAEPSQPLP